MKLVMVCVECGAVEHVQVEGDGTQIKIGLRWLLREHGWLLSLVDRRNKVFAPVCKTCAPKVYPPEVLAAARSALLND